MTTASGKSRDPDAGDGFEIGLGPAKIKLTGHLAKQAVIAFLLGGSVWYLGYSEPQLILKEVRSVHIEVTKTQVTAQAIVDAMPPLQQKQAKKMIEDRLAVLQLAQAKP